MINNISLKGIDKNNTLNSLNKKLNKIEVM